MALAERLWQRVLVGPGWDALNRVIRDALGDSNATKSITHEVRKVLIEEEENNLTIIIVIVIVISF